MIHWLIFNGLVLTLAAGYLLKDGSGILGIVAWILLGIAIVLIIKDLLIMR